MSSEGKTMYYVYVIESDLTDKYYIGYTKNLSPRWNSHRFYSKSRKSKLYDCMNKYGFDNFELVLIKAFENKEDALQFERSLISLDDENCLNLVPGGEGGFNVIDVESWKQKLREKRKGRKPALGLKHSNTTKEILRQQQIKRHELNRK